MYLEYKGPSSVILLLKLAIPEPPNRSSLWRFPEFKSQNPIPNYSDMELFCGGATTQYIKNDGKCGPCGDSYSDPIPRDNESTGKYGKGIITRKYSSGQVRLIFLIQAPSSA